MAWWRSARHAGLATAVLAFACLSLSFTGMLGGMGMPREEGVELLAAAGDFGRVVAAREMAEAAAQERSFVAKIDQVRMVKDSLSSQVKQGSPSHNHSSPPRLPSPPTPPLVSLASVGSSGSGSSILLPSTMASE